MPDKVSSRHLNARAALSARMTQQTGTGAAERAERDGGGARRRAGQPRRCLGGVMDVGLGGRHTRPWHRGGGAHLY